VREGTIEVDGRRVAFADYGPVDGDVVLWCHGGPGSRHEPAYVAERAADAGFRLVGIDRPGYGSSDPRPGRTIADWVPDAAAVADHLGVERFSTLGVSTGGAYAFAVAAALPERVRGVVACCSMTDMRHLPARDTMSRPHAHAVWEAPDRDAALAASEASHGLDGSKILESAVDAPPLAPSDQAMLATPWGELWLEDVPVMFAQGVEGYADDRIADGPGWVSFDIGAVRCPVVILHGDSDVICTVVHPHHTAELVPHAELRIVEGLGHFSIEDEIVPTLEHLRHRAGDSS
jgi:pimeloyl-ACP methyl ester carboxylesterase